MDHPCETKKKLTVILDFLFIVTEYSVLDPQTRGIRKSLREVIIYGFSKLNSPLPSCRRHFKLLLHPPVTI